jgi:hypothetical protein
MSDTSIIVLSAVLDWKLLAPLAFFPRHVEVHDRHLNAVTQGLSDSPGSYSEVSRFRFLLSPQPWLAPWGDSKMLRVIVGYQ